MTNLYDRWNDAIAQHFFREELAGRPIFLFVDEGLLGALEKKHDLPEDSFLSAIAPGVDARNVAARCLELCNKGGWRSATGLFYPPYLGYLALFVLAAGLEEEDLPDNAYYNRLRRYLGL